MNKKAFLGLGEVLKWVLIGLLILIIIMIIAGPKQLLEKTRDVLFSFGIINTGEETPEFAGKAIDNPELLDYYNGIVSGIKNAKDSEGCRIEIGERPKLKEYSIVFMPGVVQIEKKSADLTLPYDPKPITGLTPCLYDCSQTCSTTKPDKTIINDDIKVATFLYKPDKDTVCVVKDSDTKKISANKCS